ncbi:hypothetical protein, partial [Leuconostoc sp.]
TDKYAEMSSGLDAKIYFDLLCSEMQHDGIYLIDQPEDNISQKAIFIHSITKNNYTPFAIICKPFAGDTQWCYPF